MNPGRLNVGEVAFLLGIPRRRVKNWIEQGFVEVEQDAPGTGHYYCVSHEELDVVRRVVKVQQTLGIRPTKRFFAFMRTVANGDPARALAEIAAPGA